MKKIEVFKKDSGELVAGDKGLSITIDSLKEKMIHKIDITDSSLYDIVEEDLTQENALKEVQRQRKDEYIKQDLSFDKFVELLIEDDNAGLAQFRAARKSIKSQFPKPV